MKKFQTISVPKVTRIEALPISSRFCIKAMKSLNDIEQVLMALCDYQQDALNAEQAEIAIDAAYGVKAFLNAIVEGLEDENEEKDEGKN